MWNAQLLQPFAPRYWRFNSPLRVRGVNFEIYCDGSAWPKNPGQIGIGAIVVNRNRNEEIEFSSGAGHGSCDRAELIAALVSLRFLSDPCSVKVYCDSAYVVYGATRQFVPRLNLDLWEALDAECRRHRVYWTKVKSHAGNFLNERSHDLAYKAARGK